MYASLPRTQVNEAIRESGTCETNSNVPELREEHERAREATERAREGDERAREENERAREAAEKTSEDGERTREEAERIRGERARQAAERARQAAERARLEAESARQAAERARQEAESARQAAERARQAESARQAAERASQEAETTRQAAERARQAAEGARQAESARQAAERASQEEESARQAEESARQAAERARQEAESARQAAERARQRAESARQAAKRARQRAREEAERQHHGGCLATVTLITLPIIIIISPLVNHSMQFGCAICFVQTDNSSFIYRSKVDRIHDYANIFFRFIHILEYWFLLLSIWECSCLCQSQFNFELLKKSMEWMIHKLRCILCKCPDQCDIRIWNATKCVTLALFIVVSILTYVCVIVNIWMKVVRWDEHSQCNSTSPHDFCHKVCVWNVRISIVCTFIVRMIMIVVTIVVAATWLYGKSLLEDINDIEGYWKLEEGYDETGKLASQLHDIFRRWFILQWLVIFLEILDEFYFIYDVLTDSDLAGCDLFKDNGDVYCRQLKVHILLLVYRLFSFIIPYLCGLTMNYYHKVYLKKMNKKQCKYKRQWHESNLNPTPQKLEYQFRPSIYEISIPLNETAHIMTLTLALVAFVLSLVSKSVGYNY